MKKIKLIPARLFGLIPRTYRVAMSIVILLVTLIVFASPPPPITIKIMRTGLGSGTVAGPVTAASGTPVTFTATPGPGSVFVRWEGDVTGTANPVTVTLGADAAVRAVFNLATPIPTITDFTAIGIQNYLNANPIVNTPGRFVAALPIEYKRNWILMSRSESLQTGTAECPRLLLPSADARFVFTIGMMTHGSYPGSHPDAIEYMQWDAAEKNFRFHEIVLAPIPAMGAVPARTRMVSVDDSKCSKCHSTNNVLNRSSFPGTTGIPPGTVKYKNKPNWDTYDSWGGMMPLNRDRIYQGSVEAAAFRKIFNPWTWSTNDPVRSIIEQLELQPSVPGIPPNHAITRTVGGANDGHINFAFDVSPPVTTEPAPTGSSPSISTNYNFDNTASGASSSVVRGGSFVTLHHSSIPNSDEGRGVRFFDALGGLAGTLNQQRVADELISHRFATGSVPIDIRPIALAVSRGLVALNGTQTAVISTTPGLSVSFAFFDARNGTTINALYNDTKARAESVPRRKADIQKLNLDRTNAASDPYLLPGGPANGLIQQYGAGTSAGTSAASPRLRQEVFRRPLETFPGDATVMGGIYVDRELYVANTEKLTLFRYFLGPLGVSVDKWSMGVRGRSRTYSFADVFDTYFNVFIPQIKASLLSNPVPGLTDPDNDVQLIAAINSTLSSLPAPTAIPTYTDVQRIFNKSCIECHGGLEYPPYYTGTPTYLDLSENESPPAGEQRLDRSNNRAMAYTSGTVAGSYLYQRVTMTSEACPGGLMPCGGPALCKTDIETIRRWIEGGRPYTNGDPHIRTVDGVNYDFQAAGEFVLLRGENLEVQARHRPVETAPVGPDGHTGLTTCVSVNSAFAIRVGRRRITYQPNLSGKPDPSGLQLRVDGSLVQMTPRGISLGTDGRIMPTSAPGGIQVEPAGGTVIVITPGWWANYQLWYLNVDMRNVRATQGLMGPVAPGSWLPALPNGTLMGPKPADLNKCYSDLYDVFGKAWRVTDSTSLFDYAPGTSTRSFTMDGWPGGARGQGCALPRGPESGGRPFAPMVKATAEQLAAGVTDVARRGNLVQDLMATGDSGFARTYLLADKINRNRLPGQPALVLPKDFDTLRVSDIRFEWNETTDPDGDSLAYKLYVWPVNEPPDHNKAVPAAPAGKTGWLSGGVKCASVTGLIGLLLFIILYFLGLKKKRGLLVLLALAILAAVILAYFFCGKKPAAVFKANSSVLQPGKGYYWKVITEDGQGGTVESETRRIQVR